MKRNYSTKLVWILSLIVMFSGPASNGCSSRTSGPATEQTSSAQINVSSRQIASGNVVLNNISDQTIAIQNTGSGSLSIGQIAQANSLAAPFSIVSDDCSGQAVQPSAACSFKVRFSPTSQDTFTDSFDIPSNASNENSVTVDVTGSGKALRVAINEVNTDSCSATGELELIVSLTDQNNDPVAGLTSGNFQLMENGVPQTISSVIHDLTPVPISVAMVLDYTTSIQGQIPTIEAASKDFVGMLTVDDEATIVKFAQMQQEMCSFTTDTNVLTTAIDTDPTQLGLLNETRLYDALWFAVGQTAGRLNQKAIVLVSDGKDETYQGLPNASDKTLDEVIAYATENHVAIYTVGLGSVDAGVMNSLASETGGQYYYITAADQISGVYQAISEMLFGQYTIKYVSSLHGSSLITLEVDVRDANNNEGVGVLQAVGCP